MILNQSVAREIAEDALRATAGNSVEGHAEQCAARLPTLLGVLVLLYGHTVQLVLRYVWFTFAAQPIFSCTFTNVSHMPGNLLLIGT